MNRFILAVVITLAAPTLVLSENEKKEGKSERIEEKIMKIEHEWAEALAKADLKTIDGICDAEWVFVDPEGTVVTKEQSDADMKSGTLKFESFKIEDLKVKVYGDTAIVWGLETEKSSYKGKDTSGQYRFTDVFVKHHGKWQCVATQITRVATKK